MLFKATDYIGDRLARIYARKKGRSKSVRPQIPAAWVGYSAEEVERIVVKLAKDGLQPAQIGLIMRDQYGIPLIRSACGKTITRVLDENKLLQKIPYDLFNLLKKAVRLHAHMESNKKDAHGRRGLELLESRIRRLVKYYVATEKLPADWKYDAERAKLIVEKGE